MHKTLIVSAAVLAAASVPAYGQDGNSQVPVTGRVIANGTWEGKPDFRRGAGLPADWRGLQAKPARRVCFAMSCAGYSVRIVRRPVAQGTRAGRFEVRDGDNPFGDAERAEVQGRPTGPQGAGRWYTWSTYLPANFRHRGADGSRFLLLTQWAVPRGVPPLAIYVDRGTLALGVNESTAPRRRAASYRPWATPIQPLLGRWVDIAVFVRWSARRDGQVQVWLDGVQQQMNWPFGGEGVDPAAYGGVGSFVFTGRTLVPRGGATYVKQGIVRSKRLSGRHVVTHDGLRVRATTITPTPPAPVAPPVDPVAPPAG